MIEDDLPTLKSASPFRQSLLYQTPQFSEIGIRKESTGQYLTGPSPKLYRFVMFSGLKNWQAATASLQKKETMRRSKDEINSMRTKELKWYRFLLRQASRRR